MCWEVRRRTETSLIRLTGKIKEFQLPQDKLFGVIRVVGQTREKLFPAALSIRLHTVIHVNNQATETPRSDLIANGKVP